MPNGRKASTTARGLGWKHQQQVEGLLRRLVDGSLCWWCALPRFKAKDRNWDARQLAGDHTVARAAGGKTTDRLLHATCNEQRGGGTRDHLRPAVMGCHPSEWAEAKATHTDLTDTIEPRLMPWP